MKNELLEEVFENWENLTNKEKLDILENLTK